MTPRFTPDPVPPDQAPVQAVPDPIICDPYGEPTGHWVYQDGVPHQAPGRRLAGYYTTTQRIGEAGYQPDLFAEETFTLLPLVNRLRDDVRRWRESGYRGASVVTRDLLLRWRREDRPRRLFFCQRDAAETFIYLLELRIPGRSRRTGFQNFEVSDDDLQKLLIGEPPSWGGEGYFQTLSDKPGEDGLLPLRRMGCKMATGSGKTVVMAMVIAWAFCNRGVNPASTEFPEAVLICCPNLTIKERLQVLRPEHPQNYYDAFDVVPAKYREHLNRGRVLVTNWHVFASKSPNTEGDTTYRVVDKGEESNDAFALERLGELARRLPILVLNDEGHHCWRPKPEEAVATSATAGLSAEEKEDLQAEQAEARVWLNGLDRINNSGLLGEGRASILATIDLSATPFYLPASGHPQGSPFPWLVCDFGLVDAIESGIVKIPRLPVYDETAGTDEAGRPDPKYFRLWKHISDEIPEVQRTRTGRPFPDAVYRGAEGALQTLAGQWLERFKLFQGAAPTEERIPPVLIVVCDNTEIAQVFTEKISGQTVEEVLRADGKIERRTVYGPSAVLPEFANTDALERTIQMDSRALEKLEAEEGETKGEAAKARREIIATVGKRGMPGEHVRCVVSVSMLTEGWDADNVTHVLGVRAFLSQLLCEQVVGRGLRRMNYSPDPETGRLTPEYVDVYGIPFSLIPFKARPKEVGPDDKPPNHIYAVPERVAFEMRFPFVQSYVYALRKEGIRCDVEELEGFTVADEPTTVYLTEVRGFHDAPGVKFGGRYVPQDRRSFYERTHFQTVLFNATKLIVEQLVHGARGEGEGDAKIKLIAKHQLFPQVFWIVQQYVRTKVKFAPGVDKRELGLQKYVELLVERVRDGILPAAAAEDAPLLPVLNTFRPSYTTADVDFITKRPVVRLTKSHLNAAMYHSERGERDAIDILEDADCVECFVPNESRVGLTVPWDYAGAEHRYEPDFIVRVRGGTLVMLEIKGEGGERWKPDEVNAKNAAARKWVAAVDDHGGFGTWAFEICREVEQLEAVLEKHAAAAAAPPLPFTWVKPKLGEEFVVGVPLVTLRKAVDEARQTDVSQTLFMAWGKRWVTFPYTEPFERGMFVARVLGRALEPRVPAGAYCLFRPLQGDRENKILLVAHNAIEDPAYAGPYTVRVYTSSWIDTDAGRRLKVTLPGDSSETAPIVITAAAEGEISIVGELSEVVG